MSPFSVLDAGPIHYGALPIAGDADLEKQLKAFYAGEPIHHEFRLVVLPLSCCHELIKFDEYRRRGDPEWSLMCDLYNALQEGKPLLPLVFCWDDRAVRLLDGYHRGSAMRHVGHETALAYELINWQYELKPS